MVNFGGTPFKVAQRHFYHLASDFFRPPVLQGSLTFAHAQARVRFFRLFGTSRVETAARSMPRSIAAPLSLHSHPASYQPPNTHRVTKHKVPVGYLGSHMVSFFHLMVMVCRLHRFATFAVTLLGCVRRGKAFGGMLPKHFLPLHRPFKVCCLPTLAF